MTRRLLCGLVLLAGAPLAAQDLYAEQNAAEDRLRTCLNDGASDAPRESLDAAVAALRSRCYAQFTRLREARLRVAEAELRLPRGVLTSDQKIERERARADTARQLDADLMRIVSSATGLTKREAPPPPPGTVLTDAAHS